MRVVHLDILAQLKYDLGEEWLEMKWNTKGMPRVEGVHLVFNMQANLRCGKVLMIPE